jgi:hypothetical protein
MARTLTASISEDSPRGALLALAGHQLLPPAPPATSDADAHNPRLRRDTSPGLSPQWPAAPYMHGSLYANCVMQDLRQHQPQATESTPRSRT